MLGQISTRQFQEWRAYADLEPFDEERADLRSAQIVQAIFSVHRRKHQGPPKLKDCVLRFGEQDKVAATPDQKLIQTRRTLDMLTALYGSKGKRQERR